MIKRTLRVNGIPRTVIADADRVRSMANLAYGCGSGRATCGGLTGGWI